MNKKNIFSLVSFLAIVFGAVFARNELGDYLQDIPIDTTHPFFNAAPDTINKDTQAVESQEEISNEEIVDQEIGDASKAITPETKIAQEEAPVFDEFARRMPIELMKIIDQDRQEKAEPERSIEFNFEDADLQTLVSQIETLFDITFITDEVIEPLPQGAGSKAIKGNKISFKTQSPLSKQEALNLFITFLDLAGFAITSTGQSRIYRIKSIEQARKSPLSSYIGVAPELLPESDELIRYIYFIKKSTVDTINGVVDPLRSASSTYNMLRDLRAFILTDKAYNVKSILQIVKEIDKAAMPQSMSVLKLRQADAREVQKLYEDLIKADDPGYGPRALTQRKQSTTTYFPENATIIAEPRSNALIILGPEDVIKKIEEFITKYVDIELDQPYSPLFVYQVRYADARSIADIMNEVTGFGSGSEAGKSGGVRGGDKYIRPMTFTAEEETNQVIIKGDYEDYKRALEIMMKLDEPQPQVAIEVLLVSVDVTKSKELGVQLRSKVPGADGLLGKNVNFQTSGIKMGRSKGSPIIPKVGTDVTTGVKRLLGNLLDTILNPTIAGVGNTVVNFGVDACGVWGIFNILESIASTEVISNPFLVAINKTPAEVSIGQVRRTVTSTVISGDNVGRQGFGDWDAGLKLSVTPQINSDGMIVLDISINNSEFVGASTDAKTNRAISTKTVLADQEIMAVGGLIQNKKLSGMSKVPVLGDIPFLGWLFKNKAEEDSKNNIVALISVRIVKSSESAVFNDFTGKRIQKYQDSLLYTKEGSTSAKDPISNAFFKERHGQVIEHLIFDRTGVSLPTDADKKVVAQRKRSRWAQKRGRRKRWLETPPVIQQGQPQQKEDAHFPAQEPVEDLLAHHTPIKRKQQQRQSLVATLFEDSKDRV